MKTLFRLRPASEAGSSLLMTLILITITLIVLAATMQRTYSVSKLNDRNNLFIIGDAAAEAATEKVAARIMMDFQNGGLTLLSNNISAYQAMVPTASENSWWTNFDFSDGQGNGGKTYVAQTSTNPAPPYVMLETQYPGLMAFSVTWRILSNVRPLFTGMYNFTNAVQQDVQMAEIPIFQFAIFYNTELEFSDSATLTVAGRVHCNTNIDIGSSSSLTFNSMVTTCSIITNPPRAGFSQSSWTGDTNFNGLPTPGWGTGEPSLTLPIGANGTNNSASSVIQVLYPPPSTEGTTNSLSPQRFYNKAGMLVQTSNSVVQVTFKHSNMMYDTSPSNVLSGTTTWTNQNISFWLSTNNLFWDARQNSYMHVTQIDVGRLGTWMKTNVITTNLWPATTNIAGSVTNQPFNGIVYAADWRDSNSTWLGCVRLTNGAYINTNLNAMPYGLTVATPNSLYTIGDYNTNGTAYPNGTAPCSFICDAYTELSARWNDATSTNGTSSSTRDPCSSRTAQSTVINAAILTGNVPTTDVTSTTFSGGVQNLTRFLENWSSQINTLNSSLVCMYPSAQATDQFVQPSGNTSQDYYEPPTRNYSFNTNYSLSVGLPPGTPQVCRMIRATWCNAAPNMINYAPSPTIDFAPQ